MNWLMHRLTPGGFVWLMINEVRLATRAARQRRGGNLVWGLLITVYAAAGFWLASNLVHIPITPTPFAFVLVFAVAVLAMSFMTTQAMLRSQDTLYQSGDLDLLLTAPLPPRRVLLAKLCGIVANIMMVFAAFTLPIALPVALLGHPGLFGIPLVLLGLALVSACIGLAITLFIVRIASPRTARTIAQIVGAFLAAGVFLASQFLSAGPGRESAGRALVGWLVRHDYGSHGLASLPGQAALGNLPAMAAVLGGAMLVFAGAGAVLGRAFLTSYQNAPTRLTRSRSRGRAKGNIARHFRQGLFATMFAKEARLLRRDPQLAFTIVLRLIYLLPIAVPAFTHGRGPPLLPALAFFGVLIAGQLAGSLAWLTVSAEDSPDLIAVAPVEKQAAERAKLAAALLIAAPFAVVLPLAIALVSPRAAIIALAMTAASALAAGLVELKFQRPAPRRRFGNRREGSFLVGVLTFLMTGVLALGAGYLVYLAG
jgi:ABC-2 type transport system permease protein